MKNNNLLDYSNKAFNKLCSIIKISKPFIAIMGLIVLIISIIPLLKIAKYNHPVADDYDYGIITYNTWNNSHNIFKTIKSGFNTSRNFYNNWQGTYSATFLMSLNPIHFGFRSLGTYILIFSLILSIFYFLYVLFIKYLKSDKWTYLIVADILVFLSIQFCSSPVEAFYWWNGSIYYTFFYSLSLIFWGILLNMFKKNNKVISVILLSLLSFIMAGSNYTTCLANLIILCLLTIYLVILKNKNYKYLLYLFILYLGFFMINALAPGNSVRASGVTGTNAVLAVIKSFKYSIRYLVEWTNLFTIICFIIIGALVYQISKDKSILCKHPILFSSITFCIFTAQFTPPIYALSNIGEGRLHNIIHYSYYLMILLNIIYYINWFKFTILNNKLKTIEDYFNIRFKTCSGIVSLIGVGFLAINLYPMYGNLISSKAIYSLKSKEANTYYNEYLERLELYRSDDKNIEVKEHTVKPYLLYFSDITTDSTHWQNVSVEKFYNKDSVILIPNQSN